MMTMLELILFAVVPIWTSVTGAECNSWPNQTGTRVLVTCRDSGKMRLEVITADGKTVALDRISDDLLREGVPTGPVAWSPQQNLVALEIGLDEEPGVLLIDVAKRSAIFVDKPLVPLNVSAAQPQWDVSGRLLVFRTSATGEWKNEGLYVYDTKVATLFRIAAIVTRDLFVANDRVFVTQVDSSDPTKQKLSAFSLSKLLKEKERVTTDDGFAPRFRKN